MIVLVHAVSPALLELAKPLWLEACEAGVNSRSAEKDTQSAVNFRVAGDWEELQALEKECGNQESLRFLLLYSDPEIQLSASREAVDDIDGSPAMWVRRANQLLDVAQVHGRNALLLDLTDILFQRDYLVGRLRDCVLAAREEPGKQARVGEAASELYASLQDRERRQLGSVVAPWTRASARNYRVLVEQLLRENAGLARELSSALEALPLREDSGVAGDARGQISEVEQMRRSWSWRVTRPLRAVGALLLRLRRS